MIYFWALFFIKLAIIIPLSYLLYKQFANLIRKKHRNGLTQTRRTLLICTFAVLFKETVFLTADLHFLLFERNIGEWIKQAQPVIIIAKLLILYAVYRFYRLFYNAKKK